MDRQIIGTDGRVIQPGRGFPENYTCMRGSSARRSCRRSTEPMLPSLHCLSSTTTAFSALVGEWPVSIASSCRRKGSLVGFGSVGYGAFTSPGRLSRLSAAYPLGAAKCRSKQQSLQDRRSVLPVVVSRGGSAPRRTGERRHARSHPHTGRHFDALVAAAWEDLCRGQVTAVRSETALGRLEGHGVRRAAGGRAISLNGTSSPPRNNGRRVLLGKARRHKRALGRSALERDEHQFRSSTLEEPKTSGSARRPST